MGRCIIYIWICIYTHILCTCLNTNVHQVSAKRVRVNLAKLLDGNWQNKLGPIMGVWWIFPSKKAISMCNCCPVKLCPLKKQNMEFLLVCNMQQLSFWFFFSKWTLLIIPEKTSYKGPERRLSDPPNYHPKTTPRPGFHWLIIPRQSWGDSSLLGVFSSDKKNHEFWRPFRFQKPIFFHKKKSPPTWLHPLLSQSPAQSSLASPNYWSPLDLGLVVGNETPDILEKRGGHDVFGCFQKWGYPKMDGL